MSAAQALVSLGIEEALAAVLGEKCIKQPLTDPLRVPEMDTISDPLKASTQDMYEAVRGFKKPGSAPGPLGRHGEHLKEAGGKGETRGATTMGHLMESQVL